MCTVTRRLKHNIIDLHMYMTTNVKGNVIPIPKHTKSLGNSVGIVLGYRLDDRGSKVYFLVGSGNFSHHHVQNSSRAHTASYTMGTRGSFPGDKAASAWS
jgi:hypothetical protein